MRDIGDSQYFIEYFLLFFKMPYQYGYECLIMLAVAPPNAKAQIGVVPGGEGTANTDLHCLTELNVKFNKKSQHFFFIRVRIVH